MVHKGDLKILSQMLKNIESEAGKVEFKAPLVVAPPTYNIIDELKKEVIGKFSKSTLDLNLMIQTQKTQHVLSTKT